MQLFHLFESSQWAVLFDSSNDEFFSLGCDFCAIMGLWTSGTSLTMFQAVLC